MRFSDGVSSLRLEGCAETARKHLEHCAAHADGPEPVQKTEPASLHSCQCFSFPDLFHPIIFAYIEGRALHFSGRS